MIINHNMQAINAHRQMGTNATNAQKSMEKLSSGLRINRAGDDAAGLAISEKMRGQIRGLDQAGRNAQDGISLIQTAEGALNETHSILQRMRELSVQSSNDTNTDGDRAEIQKEIEQLTEEINRISTDTEFNSQKLLNGDKAATTASLPTGITFATTTTGEAATTGTLGSKEFDMSSLLTGGTLAQEKVVTIGTVAVTLVTGDDIDTIVDKLNTAVSDTYTVTADTEGDIILTQKTASTQDITVTGVSIETGGINIAGSDSTTATTAQYDLDINATALSAGGTFTIGDKEITIEAGDTLDKVLTAVSNAVGDSFTVTTDDSGLILTAKTAGEQTAPTVGGPTTEGIQLQVGANSGQMIGVSIGKMDATSLSINDLDLTTKAGSQTAIDKLDTAIKNVSSERSNLGSVQNRLEHTIANVGTASENLTAAESRIRDVDMAKEMMEMSKNNILQQASQAMLAQANQNPQQVLQLLR